MRLLSPLTACVLMSVACSEVRSPRMFTTAPLVVSPTGTTAFFDRDVQTVFDRSCTGGCHEPGGTGERDAGLDLTSPVGYDELFDPTLSRNGPHVISGDPDNSLLVWKLEGTDSAGRGVFGDRMPLGRPPLSDTEIKAIRDWISAGALRTAAPPEPPDIREVVALDGDRIQIAFTRAVDPASSVSVGIVTDTGEVEVISTGFAETGLLEVMTQALAPGLPHTLTLGGVVGSDGLSAGALSALFTYRPEAGFSADIQPIFDRSCAFIGCHAASDLFPPGEGMVLTADTSWQALVGTGSSQIPTLLRVAPSAPDSSYLLRKLIGSEGNLGEQMPLGGPFLGAGDLALIRLWIEQGALNN